LNNIQVIRNSLVAVPSLLLQSSNTGTTLCASFQSPSRCSPSLQYQQY